MDKIEITVKCNKDDFELLENSIVEGIRDRGCPFENSEKPACCGEDADCNSCIDENISVGFED